MKKNTVVCFGLVGIVLLEAIALLKGVNGVAFATALAAIGSLVGYVFRGIQDGGSSSTPAKVLALLVALGLAAGCAGGPGFQIEACIMHQTYGKICASFDGKNVKITADAQLPPEVEAEISEWIRKLK